MSRFPVLFRIPGLVPLSRSCVASRSCPAFPVLCRFPVLFRFPVLRRIPGFMSFRLVPLYNRRESRLSVTHEIRKKVFKSKTLCLIRFVLFQPVGFFVLICQCSVRPAHFCGSPVPEGRFALNLKNRCRISALFRKKCAL